MKTMKKIVAILAVALMLCSILPLSVMAADTYELATSLNVGDTVVLAYKNSKMELSGISTTSTKYGTGVAYTTAPTGAYALIVEEGYTSGTYSFKCPNGQYLYWTSGNSLNTYATKNANTSWKVSFSGDNAVITNAKDSSRKIQWNTSSPRFACYTGSQSAVQLYKLSGGEEPPVECEHAWDNDCDTDCNLGCGETRDPQHNYVEDIIDATCTQTGTKTYECSVCFDSYDEAIPTIPHNYVDGACDMCGAEEPAITEYTISFATADHRVSQDGNAQVWQNGALKLTNNKAASSNAVVANVNPVRLYASSEVIVECPNMTKIVFNCNTTGYATALKNSIGDAATVSGKVVTVEYAAPESKLTIAKLTAQVRLDSIVVTAAKAEAGCEHENAKACDKNCPDCGALINEDAAHKSNAEYPCYEGACEYCGETVEAVDHVLDANDICTVCGLAPTPENPVDPANPQEYVFSDFAAGEQYAEGEKHYLDNAITVITTQAHFTSELRIYSSSTHNGNVVIKSKKDISAIVLNAGNKVDVLNVYVSEDGEVYEAIEITSTTYKDYTILIPEMTKYIKLDVEGDQQVRVAKMTLYFDGEVPHTHKYDSDCDVDCNTCGETREVEHNVAHVEAVDATCEATGNIEYWYCEACGQAWLNAECTLNTNLMAVVLPMAEHIYDNEYDKDCNACGEIRDTVSEMPISFGGNSRSDDVSGLAFKFDVNVADMAVNGTEAIYDNATIDGYKLVSMGAIVSNSKSELDIKATYLCDLDAENGTASYAVRIINIPEANYDSEITAIPYFVVEIDGVETTIYGEAQVATYNGCWIP